MTSHTTEADAQAGRRNHASLALLVTLVIVAATLYWCTRDLGAGALVHYDEFYSYDRASGFATMNDWLSVYSLGEPSLIKPPLQYWISAVLMEAGVSDLTAMRLPSVLFAAGTLLATAALARVMVPSQVWLMPAAVLLLATSGQLWSLATSAMLDTGATFFATLGLLSIIMALKDPRYWAFFALSAFLAGLQKGPIPLGFLVLALVALALTRRFHGQKASEIFRNRQFKVWVSLGVLLAFSWPIFQEIRYWGTDQLKGNIESQMLSRFIPDNGDFLSSLGEAFLSLVLAGEPWIRLAGFAGLVLLAFTTRRPYLFAAAGTAILFAIMMVAASQNNVSPRYSLTILPLLSVGAAWLPFAISRNAAVGCAAAVALSVALGGPFRPFESFGQADPGRFDAPLSDILGPLNTSIRPEETAIFCRLGSTIPPAAIWLHAPNAGTGFAIYIRGLDSLQRDLRRYRGGPVRGVCRPDELDALRDHLNDLQSTPLPGGFALWTATSITVPGQE